MEQIKVRLTKPLDNLPEGAETSFDRIDAERLRDQHAVVFIEGKADNVPANKAATPPLNKGAKAK